MKGWPASSRAAKDARTKDALGFRASTHGLPHRRAAQPGVSELRLSTGAGVSRSTRAPRGRPPKRREKPVYTSGDGVRSNTRLPGIGKAASRRAEPCGCKWVASDYDGPMRQGRAGGISLSSRTSTLCDLIFHRPSDRRGLGNDPGPQCAFKMSMFNVSCNSH